MLARSKSSARVSGNPPSAAASSQSQRSGREPPDVLGLDLIDEGVRIQPIDLRGDAGVGLAQRREMENDRLSIEQLPERIAKVMYPLG
jgi:hypothetical protein